MAELADALDLGSSALKACRFKSCSRHQKKVRLAIQAYIIGTPKPDFPSPRIPVKLFAL